MGTTTKLEKMQIAFYMEFMEQQLIEEFGNPSELTEMTNISKEIEIVVEKMIASFSLCIKKENRINKSNDEVLDEAALIIEKDALEFDTLYNKANDICERNKKIISKITLEKGERYGKLFEILISELRLKMNDKRTEIAKNLSAMVSKRVKKNDDSQTESNDSMQMTLEKPSTTTRAE